MEEPLAVSGPSRHEVWEKGWKQNLDEYIASGYCENALLPHYYRRGRSVMRLRGDYILPISPHFEAHFLSVLQCIIASAFFRDVSEIYEFGCGPGHNLLAFGRFLPGKEYHGLDWATASSEILSLASSKAPKAHPLNRFYGHTFDLFQPDPELKLSPDSGVLPSDQWSN